MLMTTIASGPTMPTIRSSCAAAWPRRIRRRGPPASASCPVSSPSRSMRTAIGGRMALTPPAHPTACRRGGRGRPSPSTPSALPVAAMMSTRMRSVAVSVTPLPSRMPRLRQNRPVRWKLEHRATPPAAATPPTTIAARMRRPPPERATAPATSTAAATASSIAVAAQQIGQREKRLDRPDRSWRRNRAAPTENCGSTNDEEEDQHARRRPASTKAG